MCIIAAQVKGSPPIASDTLQNCYTENPHGAGYMFCHGGKVIIRKAFFNFAEFESAYLVDHSQYGAESPFILHFRWMTHGSKNALNTHPHPVIPDTVALVHNGILHVPIPDNEDISDTIAFIRQGLEWRTPEQLLGKKFRKRLARAIGINNKFVILRADGAVSIVNEREGDWAGDVWYSNTGYLPKRQRKFFLGVGGTSNLSATPANGYSFGHGLWDYDTYKADEWEGGRAHSKSADELTDEEYVALEQCELEEEIREALEAEYDANRKRKGWEWDSIPESEWRRRKKEQQEWVDAQMAIIAKQEKALDERLDQLLAGEM